MGRRARVAALGVLAGVALLGAGAAGLLGSRGAGPVALAAQETPLARGEAALRAGRYDEAVALLASALDAGPATDRVRAARSLAAAHAATGEHDRALAALDAAAASLPAAELALARGRVLRLVGRDDDALAAYDAAIAAGADDAIPARLERAVLRWERGERAAAYGELDGFIDLYNEGRARSAPELLAVAEAVRRLGRREPALLHDAVRAYEEAMAADPGAPEPRIRLAELFLDAYNGAEAQRLLADVLAANPRHADALAALARARRFEGSDEALDRVEAARAVNPRSVPALTLLALLRLELGDEAAALDAADAALAVNPRSREALAVRAAARHFADEAAAAEADRRRALALDPTFAGAFTTTAEVAVRRGRYEEAVALARRAVAVDSTAWDARALLGMNLLRTGDLEGARRELERAFAGDPFNVWSKNTLDLMDRLAAFETRRTPRFELVLHADEAALLAPYVEDVAEQAYDVLSERYGYRPETPVRVEVYPRHADFSVRTMGLPGLGALGVAFGNVLAMDSPAARDVGTFHWGSTLWHEIAHAVTLGATGHRVPRWLTEGISVREERRSRPGWGGGVGLDFLRAFAGDRLLPMARIDEGFVRPSWPGQVAVSYQHAGLVVEWVEAEHGQPAVRALLDGYAEGRGTGAVFREVLGTDPDDVDRRFGAWVRQRFGAGIAAVESFGSGQDDGHGAALGAPPGDGDPAALVRAAGLRPDDFAAQLAAGTALFRAGRGADAEPFLERARELFPEYAGPGSPYALLAEVRRDRGDREGAAAALRRLTALNESAYAANLELAALLESLGDNAGAADALERAVYISPYDPGVHDRLARLAATLGRPGVEVRERRAIVALDPVDRAGALYDLAVAHRRAGDAASARRAVLDALEVAPAFADAQELLLELSGGAP